MLNQPLSLRGKPFPIQLQQTTTFESHLKVSDFKQKHITHRTLSIIPCNYVHTFFMRYPIDVVFLDRDHRFIDAVQSLHPWKVIPPVAHCKFVLKLTEGTIETYKITIGDKINFI